MQRDLAEEEARMARGPVVAEALTPQQEAERRAEEAAQLEKQQRQAERVQELAEMEKGYDDGNGNGKKKDEDDA